MRQAGRSTTLRPACHYTGGHLAQRRTPARSVVSRHVIETIKNLAETVKNEAAGLLERGDKRRDLTFEES
jgi:hypothetical protein